MSDRDEPRYPTGDRAVGDDRSVHPSTEAWRDQTTPGITPVSGGGTSGAGATAAYGSPGPGAGAPAPGGYGSGGYGSPGYGTAGYGSAGGDPSATAPEYSTRPVAVRRADALAALLLILAGIAAGVSLVLHWLADTDQTGWTLLRDGLRHIRGSFSNGLWQPEAIILGGGVLFVLGLLLLIPARAHRFLGLLALLVSLAVAAGILVPLADENWHLDRFAIGFWVGIGVAALGLLGSLKALFTGPRTATVPRAT